MAIDSGYKISALTGAGLTLQYSADGTNWHDAFVSTDIYMRQKVDGGSWSSAIKIVGEDGKNAITMTSATTPSGEYNGQIGIWQGQIYKWNGTWVNQEAIIPTDSVLHYSFDEVPDLPDGTAVARYTEGNTYQFQSTTYKFTLRAVTGATGDIVNSNGNVQISFAGAQYAGVYIATSSDVNGNVWNKIIKLKIKVTQINGTLKVYSGLYNSVYPNITSAGSYEITCLHYNDKTSKAFYLLIDNASSSVTFTVEQIYIGSGSYSTPIIDNSGNSNHATNNGAIAVEGVSGRGGYFLNGKYANLGTAFNLASNFSLSMWIKPDNATNGLIGNIFTKGNQILLQNGTAYVNNLSLAIRQNDAYTTTNIGAKLTANTWTHLVITKNGATVNVYRNGALTTTETLPSTGLDQNNNAVYLGGSSNTRPQTLDDLQIFSRALSEQEVLGLYYSKANTPKYYGQIGRAHV